jgi:hypothetical protein
MDWHERICVQFVLQILMCLSIQILIGIHEVVQTMHRSKQDTQLCVNFTHFLMKHINHFVLIFCKGMTLKC